MLDLLALPMIEYYKIQKRDNAMESVEKKKEDFKKLCSQYFSQLSIVDLRNYGRFLKLPAPTCLKKSALICEILDVLCEEKSPERNKRGAPIKNAHFQADILSAVKEIKEQVFGKTCNDLCEKKDEEVGERSAVALQLSIQIEKLDGMQKQRLKDFINSL